MATPNIPCRQQDPDLWFPVGSTGPALMQEQEAKSLCFLCPIQAECLDTALKTQVDYGVWGGYSAAERRAIRRTNPNFTLRETDADHQDRTSLTRALASTTSSQTSERVGQRCYRS